MQGVEEGEGVSSRRISQEFQNIRNIFKHNGQSNTPLSFSNISTNGRVGSVRKVKKIASVHTNASVGPKVPISSFSFSSLNMQTERESRMGSVQWTSRKRGSGEGDDGSKKKRIRRPW